MPEPQVPRQQKLCSRPGPTKSLHLAVNWTRNKHIWSFWRFGEIAKNTKKKNGHVNKTRGFVPKLMLTRTYLSLGLMIKGVDMQGRREAGLDVQTLTAECKAARWRRCTGKVWGRDVALPCPLLAHHPLHCTCACSTQKLSELSETRYVRCLSISDTHLVIIF